MKQDKIYLDKEFDRIWEKIEKGENIALVRYGDGERAIMTGNKVVAQEGWISPNHVSKLGSDLLKSLQVDNENFIYAISCPCCDNSAYYWYNSRIKNNNITFANLFVNSNYQKFIGNFEKLNRDAIFIGNYRAENKPVGNLNILNYYLVSDDCFSFWDNEASEMIDQIKKDFGNRNDLLYVISAGPMSEPIIAELYKNNPNNCYIDFGSSIDKYIHQNQTRPYMDENTPYATQNCCMDNPKTTNFDVSVILTLYKRPENLELQLKAIEEQTLKPKEILLFQDGIDSYYKIEISNELKERFDLIEVSEKNQGVWARFKFAQKAKSQYVCVFDDDTIPGKRWLENCHSQMLKQEGLYGTIGILMEEPEKYAYEGHFRVGWDGPLDIITKVDLVGHSWFFKKDWAKYLFKDTEEFQNLKTAAEDMCFSAQLQKHGIKTFVPPHPPKNKSFWGSQPNYAIKLGQSACALSFTPENHKKMNWAVNKLLEQGWQPLVKTNPQYVEKIKKMLLSKSKKQKKKFKLFGVTRDGDKRFLHILGIRIHLKKKK